MFEKYGSQKDINLQVLAQENAREHSADTLTRYIPLTV